ncbi:MAG: aminotransferase class I/II-fold pyridoxal phosphate-dependent enzyme [Oscillospiraceae bacterium]|nr:aminotransferase class I/II-fold pyridoxal phosphate-dependent enzyme [Oscillospiraceae bacterium]
MEDAPLYSALCRFTDTEPVRMHMPGHKGKGLPGWERLADLDLTELPPTGDLYREGGAIREAQKLWADVFGMAACQMLTCGSTQGVYAALTLACPPGSRVLIDRNCHRSVYNAMALLDLRPVYVMKKDPETVESALKADPDIRTFCVTSPDYYGRLADLDGLSRVCAGRGVTLAVDGAHGAHLPFLGIDHFRGADLAVCSAHKTLPALGQSALLFSKGAFSPDDLRGAAALYGTSSPSFPILASMDLARAWMRSPEGAENTRRVADRAAAMRRRFPALSGENTDPMRLTFCVEDGPALERALQNENIWPEMADARHVVLILSPLDTDAELDRLEEALTRADPAPAGEEDLPAPPEPEIVMTPRQAFFAKTELLPLSKAAGRTAARQIGPYPPGIPVVAPGEKITKKHLEYLEMIGYNKKDGEKIPVVRQDS